MDRDPAAEARATPLADEFGSAFRLVHGNFADSSSPLEALGLGRAPLDGAFLDLGLSSFQLTDPQRGFSFAADGPLDMRFDPADALTAAEVVNIYPQRRLQELIRELGQELWAGPIAKAIVRRRQRERFSSTRELAELVGGVIPRRHWPRHIDPATKTFQAIRMEVNDELGSLRRGLEVLINHLKPGGRLGVVSFHSLEDKAVKDLLNVEAKDCICPPQQPVCTCDHKASVIIHPPHPLRPGKGEVEANPRSRSARLRGAVKLPLPEGSPLLQPRRGRTRQRRNDRSQIE
jgi:16S rRNA (cytosine1402-N4)-methyltransferase